MIDSYVASLSLGLVSMQSDTHSLFAQIYQDEHTQNINTLVSYQLKNIITYYTDISSSAQSSQLIGNDF